MKAEETKGNKFLVCFNQEISAYQYKLEDQGEDLYSLNLSAEGYLPFVPQIGEDIKIAGDASLSEIKYLTWYGGYVMIFIAPSNCPISDKQIDYQKEVDQVMEDVVSFFKSWGEDSPYIDITLFRGEDESLVTGEKGKRKRIIEE